MSPRTQKRQESEASVPRPRRPAKAEQRADQAATVAEATGQETSEQSRLKIPVIHTSVQVPAIGLPDLSSVPGRVLWLGGLGAFAALGAIDWPVAVAIAAGTWVAEQRAKERLRQEQEVRQEQEARGGA